MASLSDGYNALRLRLAALNGYAESTQPVPSFLASPRADRRWAVEVPETDAADGVRLGRPHVAVSLLRVHVARSLRKQQPGADYATRLADEATIRAAIEDRTGATVRGVRRSFVADGTFAVHAFDVTLVHESP